MTTLGELKKTYNTPFPDLIYQAATTHRQYHPSNEVQLCSLISIKTGGCPEDCHYCPQSARYRTNISKHGLLSKSEILEMAEQAMKSGVTRICLGGAWREAPQGKKFEQILEAVRELNKKGLEVCCTLGLLSEEQAVQLKQAHLYAYNHNLDSSKEFYSTIITTRHYNDRLKTLSHIQKQGISTCCGGIIGMGESLEDRLKMLLTLSKLSHEPESIPINLLVPVEGTPLAKEDLINTTELIRMVATTRIFFPKAKVRLSAGRSRLSEAEQGLCFTVGANSIHFGKKLLTQKNSEESQDLKMFKRLGIKPWRNTDAK